MNQVTEKKEGALAVNLFEADAQQGAQNISQEDLALPFLKILGQLSPEVNKRDGKYNVLKWDKQERKYYPIEINLYEKGEIDDN